MKPEKQRLIKWFFEEKRIACTRSGGIKNLVTGRVFECAKNNGGYLGTMFSSAADNIKVSTSVHQAIWLYFKGEIPLGFEINHKDGIKENNSLSNLELVTRSENNAHAARLGLRKFHCDFHMRRKLSGENVLEIRAMHEKGTPQKVLAEKYGVAPNTISQVCAGITWSKL